MINHLSVVAVFAKSDSYCECFFSLNVSRILNIFPCDILSYNCSDPIAGHWCGFRFLSIVSNAALPIHCSQCIHTVNSCWLTVRTYFVFNGMVTLIGAYSLPRFLHDLLTGASLYGNSIFWREPFWAPPCPACGLRWHLSPPKGQSSLPLATLTPSFPDFFPGMSPDP